MPEDPIDHPYRNGKTRTHSRTRTTERADPVADPVYDLPFIGPLVRDADALRTRLQGKELTRREAELLRAEARALRHLANYLETRALQLDRLVRGRDGDPPRVTRIELDP